MTRRYLKSQGVYKKGDSYIVLHGSKEITVGSTEFQELSKKFQLVDGKFDESKPITQTIPTDKKLPAGFDIKELVRNYDKNLLPEIKLNSRKPNKIKNPFTKGTFDKTSTTGKKTYKNILILYKKVGNKLVPREKPTHIFYMDKNGKHFITKRDSHKYKQLKKDKEFTLIGNSFVRHQASTTKTALNGTVTTLTVYPDTNDLALHSANSDVIKNLILTHLQPYLQEDFTVIITVNVLVNGKKFTYNHAHDFLNYFYSGGDLETLAEAIESRVGRFDEKIFNSEDYTASVNYFSIMLIPPLDKGGCTTETSLKIIDPEDNSIVLMSYQVPKDSNDCLLAILKRNSPRTPNKTDYFVRNNSIRKYLGLPLKEPIHWKEIETKNLANYFQLTIYLDRMGQVHKWGQYPTTIYLKLRQGHYYQMIGKKLINHTESRNAYKTNQELKEEGEEELSVLQPNSNLIMQEPIDPNWVVNVRTIEDGGLEWGWRTNSQIGKLADFLDWLFSLQNQLGQEEYLAINKKLVEKKILVHCFHGSELLYPALKTELDRRGIGTRHFSKDEQMVLLSFLRCYCFDLTTLFQTNFTSLVNDCGLATEETSLATHQKTFELIAADFYFFFNVHVNDYISVPNLGEVIWKSMIRFNPDQLVHFLEPQKYNFVLKAVKGARNYPLKKDYVASKYDQIIAASETERKEIMMKETGLSILDSFGCYPAAMSQFNYPAGPSRWLTKNELKNLLEKDQLPLGIYRVGYSPPENIRVPVLMRHDFETGKLVSDLKPGYGVYTSVDLNQALKSGYQIEVITEGLVWATECDSYFSDYMKKVVQLKVSPSHIRQRLGKLLMNSLYGRLLYRTNHNKATVCTKIEQLQKYAEANYITNFTVVGEKIIVDGHPKNEPNRYNVPIHLGAFVLSYAKAIMMNYIKTIDSSLQRRPFYYTDNDSLLVDGTDLAKLTEAGYVFNRDKSYGFTEIGKLKNDLNDGHWIIKARFLAPKIYYYTYVTYEGKLKTIVKTAGLPRSFVNQQLDLVVEVFFNQMKPIEYETPSGIREFTPHLWTGMNYDKDLGEWFPNTN